VVFFPDGSTLIAPELHALAEKVGLHTTATQPFYDLVIIGGGPAGLAAAVYGASEGLHTVMIEKDATGGQAGTSSRIENYLGFPNGLSGADLARRATTQALRFGVEILNTEEVAGLRAEENLRFVRLAGGSEINGRALLIATGVSVRRLEAPGVEALTGAGIYYGAALTEATFYRGKDVVVVGGANSAGQAAIYFSRFVNRVCMLVRDVAIENGMSRYLVDQIKLTPNIQVMTNAEVLEARGDERLGEVAVADRTTKQVQILPAAAMFVFIGAVPRTDMLDGLVQRDPAGYILTGPDLPRDGARPLGWTLERDPFLLETSCPGIFAAGDVRHGSIKRVATAVGEGAMAVALVHQYLKTV
jgi:thioredoxin reductase (NADPH)